MAVTHTPVGVISQPDSLGSNSSGGNADPYANSAPVPNFYGSAANPLVSPYGAPLPTPKSTKFGSRYRKSQVLGAIIGGLLVLAGAYVGANWFFADHLAAGTTVAGVEIGRMTKTQAISTLEQQLLPRSREPITLVAGAKTYNLDPTRTGIAIDANTTVENLTGFTLSPERLIGQIRSGTHPEPLVLAVAEDQLANAARTAAVQLATRPVDGTVVFSDGVPVATNAVVGLEIAPDEISKAVVTNWLVGAEPIRLVGTPINPSVTQPATDAAFTLANQITSAPVQLNIGGQRLAINPQAISQATVFRADDGELVPHFDGEQLKESVLAVADNLLRDPVNASFAFVDGRPTIVGGETGLTLDADLVAAGVATAATSAQRTVDVELVEWQPEVTVASLEALGVNEVVSSFATTLTPNVVRTNNLRRGAELINGTLVRPGETFSLLNALGPITAANGFGQAGVIVAGQLTQGTGGGLSQLATTAYNAGFFAGFEDIESRPHSQFISRYPAGREATIVAGSLDMRFRNNTPYGAIIQSWVAGNQIHVAIWSTPYFRVETSASARTNPQPATMITSNAPDCIPSGPGAAGFTITNFRQVFRLDNSELVLDEAKTWRYTPDHGRVCTYGQPAANG